MFKAFQDKLIRRNLTPVYMTLWNTIRPVRVVHEIQLKMRKIKIQFLHFVLQGLTRVNIYERTAVRHEDNCRTGESHGYCRYFVISEFLPQKGAEPLLLGKTTTAKHGDRCDDNCDEDEESNRLSVIDLGASFFFTTHFEIKCDYAGAGDEKEEKQQRPFCRDEGNLRKTHNLSQRYRCLPEPHLGSGLQRLQSATFVLNTNRKSSTNRQTELREDYTETEEKLKRKHGSTQR
ncbi:hypothetical protein H6P81_018740 [Aristolochia fimbriata]|uniref:Uncharacterized protein n=1 Tax=Aristolochia fimbriata TaxID=158543 RepID=A0AAV7E4W9_ARIFI|nr:hypothetical protein H6P81_018740 [Aristolochia fimbriata]